jgi:RNase P subunit RPR2
MLKEVYCEKCHCPMPLQTAYSVGNETGYGRWGRIKCPQCGTRHTVDVRGGQLYRDFFSRKEMFLYLAGSVATGVVLGLVGRWLL